MKGKGEKKERGMCAARTGRMNFNEN